MTRRIVALACLVFVWLAMWRDLSIANVISGVLAGAVLLAVYPLPPAQHRMTVRPVALLRFLVSFVASVTKANLIVAWEVITPRNRVKEGVVAVPLTTRDPIIITIVSHAICLSPGTLVIDIEREPSTVLFVHALHLYSPEAVQRDVRRLERLATAALAPRRSHEVAEMAEPAR